MKYLYIYIAGPITKGDTLRNIRKGILKGTELIKLGYVPMIPHQDFLAYMMNPGVLHYEKLLELDFAWIRKCDALLRLPGESAGADREEEFACEIGIPVFKTVEELEAANGRGT